MSAINTEVCQKAIHSLGQQQLIAYVAEHNSGFATPAPRGGVYVYSHYVTRTGRVGVDRALCRTFREVRAILGY